jgi:hypothetical protein
MCDVELRTKRTCAWKNGIEKGYGTRLFRMDTFQYFCMNIYLFKKHVQY